MFECRWKVALLGKNEKATAAGNGSMGISRAYKAGAGRFYWPTSAVHGAFRSKTQACDSEARGRCSARHTPPPTLAPSSHCRKRVGPVHSHCCFPFEENKWGPQASSASLPSPFLAGPELVFVLSSAGGLPPNRGAGVAHWDRLAEGRGGSIQRQ